jgi:hypothetical protein
VERGSIDIGGSASYSHNSAVSIVDVLTAGCKHTEVLPY